MRKPTLKEHQEESDASSSRLFKDEKGNEETLVEIYEDTKSVFILQSDYECEDPLQIVVLPFQLLDNILRFYVKGRVRIESNDSEYMLDPLKT